MSTFLALWQRFPRGPTAGSKPLIWESGPDASFWISLVVALIAAAAALWGYVALAGVVRRAPVATPPSWASRPRRATRIVASARPRPT